MPQMPRIRSQEEFDRLLATSHERPVFLFKHSRICGASAQAFEEVEAFLEEQERSEVALHLLEIQEARPLSREIAEQVGVRHESPQVLLFQDGQVVWHASHWRVTTRSLAEAWDRFRLAPAG